MAGACQVCSMHSPVWQHVNINNPGAMYCLRTALALWALLEIASFCTFIFCFCSGSNCYLSATPDCVLATVHLMWQWSIAFTAMIQLNSWSSHDAPQGVIGAIMHAVGCTVLVGAVCAAKVRRCTVCCFLCTACHGASTHPVCT